MTDTSIAATHLAEGNFRVGSVIRRSASVLLRHFLTFSIVAVIAYSPILLLAEAQTAEQTDLTEAVSMLAWYVPGLILLIVFSTLGDAIIMHAAFQDICRRRVRLVESLNAILRHFLPIVGLAFVMHFLIWVGLILLIIPGFIIYMMWFVGLPACVVERLGPWTSLRRSRDLTKGHRWKIFFGLALLLIVISLGSKLLEFELTITASPAVGLFGRLIWKGVWSAFASVLVVVTYHDLRTAKEGIDIEQVAVVFD